MGLELKTHTEPIHDISIFPIFILHIRAHAEVLATHASRTTILLLSLLFLRFTNSSHPPGMNS